jgi:hypothetical protein
LLGLPAGELGPAAAATSRWPCVHACSSGLVNLQPTLPWNALLPDRLVWLTMPPPVRPYCAGTPVTCTLTSCSVSPESVTPGRA